ncbi:MAG: methyltransferase domain-containing protein [Cytophagaceae bacterium]|jgi:SAM-dependent methyltransferase|nr:methyltransferase domain-containing protein [Cytophagaceae bacterium]
MQYDPVKKSLGKIFNKTPQLRIFFYWLLDLLLLRSWYVHREVKRWAKTGRPNASALDAGSGFGQYVWWLSNIGEDWVISGFDIKPEQVADCNKFFFDMNLNLRVNFKEADLTRINNVYEFDVILAIDVMEHIEDDEQVMRNFYQALRENGVLIISTPSDCGGSDTHHHSHNHGVAGFVDEHVRNGYNMQDIEVKLKRAGFSHVESRYTYGIPGNIAWKLSMKYPILMLNKTKYLFILLPFYYILTYPFAFILNCIDVTTKHKKGTGLLVVAKK